VLPGLKSRRALVKKKKKNTMRLVRGKGLTIKCTQETFSHYWYIQ
jgi:hypothetical protein